jgi:hypothetical protein
MTTRTLNNNLLDTTDYEGTRGDATTETHKMLVQSRYNDNPVTKTIKTHTKFGTTFYEGSGAKNEAIKNADANNHKFVVSWQCNNSNYWYGSYNNKINFINNLSKTPEIDRKFYEVLTGFCNTYADLEWTDMNIREDDVIDNFMSLFKQAFRAIDCEVDKYNVSWSVSSGVSKKSLHFNYIDTKFWKNSKEQNKFWNHFKNILYTLKDDCQALFYLESEGNKTIEKCLIDFAVYTKDRQWRTIYSHKHGSDRVLKPCNKHAEIYFEDLEDFNSEFDANCWLAVRDIIRSEPDFYILPENTKTVCKIKPVEINNDDLEIIISTHVPNTTIGTVQGNLITLKTIGVRKCIINGEDNLTDNSFLVLKKDGIYFGCHDEGCKNRLTLIHKIEASVLNDDIQYYQDWRKLKEIKNITIEEVESYCKRAFAFIDTCGRGFWITKNLKDGELHIECLPNIDGRSFDKTFIGIDNVKIRLRDTLYKLKENCLDMTYDFIDFMPYSPTQIKNNPQLLESEQHKHTFNLFTGFKAKPIWDIKKEQFKKVDILLSHILNVWCKGDNEISEYILNWLAHLFQFPDKKTGIMLLFKSTKQGAGKNIIFDFIKEWIYGDKNCLEINDIDQLTSKFNSLVGHKLLTLCDEVGMFGTDHKNADKLKNIITQKTQRIEKKGMDAYTVNDYNNFIALTNNDWAMKIECGDRRHVCCELSNEQVDNKAYFDEIGECFNSECGNIFYSMLLFRDISNWNKLNIPMTELKREMKLNSTVPSVLFMIDVVGKDKNATLNLSNDMIHSDNLWTSFKEWLDVSKPTYSGKYDSKRFKTELRNKLELEQYRIVINGNRRNGYKINFKTIKTNIRDFMKDPKFKFADEICDLELVEENNKQKYTNDEICAFQL